MKVKLSLDTLVQCTASRVGGRIWGAREDSRYDYIINYILIYIIKHVICNFFYQCGSLYF